MNREHSCIINKWLRWWCLGNISCLDESFSKCGSQTSSISITWELIKNAKFWDSLTPTPDLLSQKLEVRRAICFIKSFQRCWRMINLRTTGFGDMSNLAHSLFLVSQISLKHSHFHSFTYRVGCFCTITAVLSSCKSKLIAKKAYNILFSGPVQEKPCDPLV